MRSSSKILLAGAGLMFAFGCGYLAWTLSIGLFAAAFEMARALEWEGPLESKDILNNMRLAAWWLGAAAGAALFWRWNRSDLLLTDRLLHRWIAIALVVAGTTHAGLLLINGASVEAMILTAFISFVAGSLLAASACGSFKPVLAWVGRVLLGGGAGAALIFAALAFDKTMLTPYSDLGKERFVWIKLEFSRADMPRPAPETIAVEMRTAGGRVRGFAVAWEEKDGRPVLPVRVDFTEKTADRDIIVSIPGHEPITLKMPFARNPKPMFEYSAPLPAGGGLLFRYRVT